ncbi:hypothetical protein [Cellulosimicrobium arenosum]|uniref:Uncharacterized protein n=1 Tax=Cellulosimicrobium arenosum TaxID=2708133 RepID=A0A927G6V0_9MICO|nr:hypothetical protein [Cellulosimicrobium arenosum]MBD8077629.1 hypothetical protein [Cellulosimicrobium arenosum]
MSEIDRPRGPGDESGATRDADLGSVGTDVPRLARIATQVLAPAALLTALLYFFGRQRVTFFFYYFGVDVTSLQLTQADYLVQAQDGFLLPLAVVAVGVLIGLWVRGATTRVTGGRRLGRRGLLLVGLTGAILVVFGMFQAVWPGRGLADGVPTWLAPVCLALGVLTTAAVVRAWRAEMHRSTPGWRPPSVAARLTEWAAVFVLVAVALFWAVANYSAEVGERRGRQFEAELATYPGVVVRSTTDLQLVAPGVEPHVCAPEGSAFRYRYDGLVLMQQAGGTYFLVPRDWTRTAKDSAVLAVPVTDDVRLDYLPPDPAGSAPRRGPVAHDCGEC